MLNKFKNSLSKYLNSTNGVSEQIIEEALIFHLVNNLHYTYNEKIITDSDLKLNFREKIEKLNNYKLTDKEFESWWIEFNSGDVFQRFITLKSKLKVIDDRPNESQKTLMYFDTKNIDNNSFEIVNQMWVKNDDNQNRRFDINILINGIPIIHIELKREDKNIRESIKQIDRYKRNGAISKFLNFTKIYIATTGSDTLYFSNNKEINSKFSFRWADEANKNYSEIIKLSNVFFKKDFIIDFITNFFVYDEKKEVVKICRPYQYHAIKKTIDRAISNNYNESERSGYVWHATGSGKTMTSFKVCEILLKEKAIDNVIFLVDRVDLNDQTFDNFGSFTTSDKLVAKAFNSKNLVNLIHTKENEDKIIITTIQKLNNVLCNTEYNKTLKDIKHKKIVFIIDECHRSQLGKMRDNINKFFDNVINLAFTGTPIFDINAGRDGRTTQNIFGKEIHRYTSQNAINDKNVLPITFSPVQSLIIEKEMIESVFDDDMKENNSDDLKVDVGRIKSIVNYIAENYNKVTCAKTFNALLAVSSIPESIIYYDLFKKLTNLKVSIIFSISDTLGPMMKINEKQKQFYEKIIKNYDPAWNLDSADKYKSNISKEFADAKNRTIDILIVVSMLLTGYDSPITNTLFLDKSLRYQGLVQAISRTNRLFNNEKLSGQVISFKTTKETLDEALKLYTTGGINTPIGNDLWKSETYIELKENFSSIVDSFKEKFNKANELSSVVKQENEIQYLDEFKKLMFAFTNIRTMVDFSWDNFNMNDREYGQYLGFYKNIIESCDNKELIHVYNDYEIIEMEKVHIDGVYLKQLIDKVRTFNGIIPDDIEEFELYKKIVIDIDSRVSNKEERELLKGFVNQRFFYEQKSYENIYKLWSNYINAKISETQEKALVRWKSTSKSIKSLIDEYKLKKELDNGYIVEELPYYDIDELFDVDKFRDVKDTITKLISLEEIRKKVLPL